MKEGTQSLYFTKGGDGGILTLKRFATHDQASIGIGALILFIAMILVAAIAANVMLQTITSLSEQALTTGQETIQEVSGGLKVTQVNGYVVSSLIDQLAFIVSPLSGSDQIDLDTTFIGLSDSSTKVILNYTSSCFSSSVSSGLFGTINASNLTSSTYGLMVIRDVDSSCTVNDPTINDQDLVVLLVNTTTCFSGISTRTEVTGEVVPEFGTRGVISFVTPPAYVDTIETLQ